MTNLNRNFYVLLVKRFLCGRRTHLYDAAHVKCAILLFFVFFFYKNSVVWIFFSHFVSFHWIYELMEKYIITNRMCDMQNTISYGPTVTKNMFQWPLTCWWMDRWWEKRERKSTHMITAATVRHLFSWQNVHRQKMRLITGQRRMLDEELSFVLWKFKHIHYVTI